MGKRSLIVFIITMGFVACKNDYTPKPRGYFRIDFPEKKYQTFESNCPYTFEYPEYGEIEKLDEEFEKLCWQNISFPDYRAKIHMTYIPLNNDLSLHSEEIRSLVYKHIVKADDIKEQRLFFPENNAYGIIYSLSGNTASSLTFLMTDSVNHFLSGSLYFSSIPNHDSLAPAIHFFQEDVVHLTESLTWK